MDTFLKVLRDMPLERGSHVPGEGACVMEKVAILWGLHNGLGVEWSALPECTNEVVTRVAQVVNDTLDNISRQRLNALIPRLLRARRTDSDGRVNVRLAVEGARRALHLVTEQKSREACEAIIAAIETWLETGYLADRYDPLRYCDDVSATMYRPDAISATVNAYNAALAIACPDEADLESWKYAYRAWTDLVDAALVAEIATRGYQVDLVAMLDDLLDLWEEAVTKEGEDLYIPREWEDEALAFVTEFMAEDSHRDKTHGSN